MEKWHDKLQARKSMKVVQEDHGYDRIINAMIYLFG